MKSESSAKKSFSLKPPTAHDVAKLAGVSQAAVSRAYTPGASVSAKMRARIELAAAELNYRPNLLARSLITKRSYIIGVVVGFMENPFYANLLQRLSASLQQQGFHILLFTTDGKTESEPGISEILKYQIDALVLASASLCSEVASQCIRNGIPVVLVNRKDRSGIASSVTGDNKSGAAAIADHLVERGCARIGFISGNENSSTSVERETAFENQLKKRGQTIWKRASGNYTFEGAACATRTLMDGAVLPDAIFCANDHMAIACIEVLRHEYQKEVGKDIAVAGFDDIDVASRPAYMLTTFSQPLDMMIEELMHILTNIHSSEHVSPVEIIVEGKLVIRQSA